MPDVKVCAMGNSVLDNAIWDSFRDLCDLASQKDTINRGEQNGEDAYWKQAMGAIFRSENDTAKDLSNFKVRLNLNSLPGCVIFHALHSYYCHQWQYRKKCIPELKIF